VTLHRSSLPGMSLRDEYPDFLPYGVVAKELGLDPDTGRETIRGYVMAKVISAVELKPGVHRIHRNELDRLRAALEHVKG
jgi:hypothetical protein